MIRYCLEKWDANNHKLKEAIENNDLMRYDYGDLLKLTVRCILNDSDSMIWDADNISVIDNGTYEGTQLFVIPLKTSDPSEYEYLMTYAGYGSCGGCDTILWLQDKPKIDSDEKNEIYMRLCKDLITNMIRPYNYGWRNNEKFNPIEDYSEN